MVKYEDKDKNNQVTQSILNLRGNTDWQTFVMWVRDSYLQTLMSAARIENDVRSRWEQGKALNLEEVLTRIDRAPQDAELADDRKQPRNG